MEIAGGELFRVANPNRVKSKTSEELYAELGRIGVKRADSKQLTKEEIEELTTRVD